MYAFISKKNEIVILEKEKIDFDDISIKIFSNDKEIIYTDINIMQEFLNEEYWQRHCLILDENLDISKSNKVVVGEKKLLLDVKQYFKTKEFKEEFTYTGNDLGCTRIDDKTLFKIWAPTATEVNVNIYNESSSTDKFQFEMAKGEQGIFFYRHYGDLKGKFYTFEVTCHNATHEVVDIYAKAVSANGEKGAIVDIDETSTFEFSEHSFENPESITDTIIYETHIRDLSMNENSGINAKGKYLGFCENNSKNSYGELTGISHIVELGATHIHLLPVQNFKTIDETKLNENDYNWGYDPQNYNIPEGSYSTNPNNPTSRIIELKALVLNAHKNGLGVILDVVYNHIYDINLSNYNKIVPGYYFRTDSLGNYTNGSGCGNEIASERYMVRKHIIDSLIYWAKEYKIDGFRFDLMGLYDVETINQIRVALDNVNPNLIMYGEGWTGGETPLYEENRAIKQNAEKTNVRIGYFSDDIRDAIKGHVFDEERAGFVNGRLSVLEDLKFGLVGCIRHKEIDYDNLSKIKKFWANEPTQVISYCSSHDNLTLFDKLSKVSPSATREELIQQNKLAAFITHISQGALFYQAGEEFARTKNGDNNSYISGDEVNSLDWNRKNEFNDLYKYYKGLAELRMSDKVFRLSDSKDINKCVSFGECKEQFLVVKYRAKNGKYSRYIALVNAQSIEENYTLEKDTQYKVLVNGELAGVSPFDIFEGSITIPPKTAVLLGKEKPFSKELKYLDENKKNIAIITAVTTGVVIISKLLKKKK